MELELIQFVSFPALHKVCVISHFFFFLVPKINSKGHKTFLRKEAVVAKLLETIWIWIRVLPQEVPALLSLLLPNVSLLSFCSTMQDQLLSGEPFVLIFEKPFLTICTFHMGFVHMDLKHQIGLEGICLKIFLSPLILLS